MFWPLGLCQLSTSILSSTLPLHACSSCTVSYACTTDCLGYTDRLEFCLFVDFNCPVCHSFAILKPKCTIALKLE